MLYHGRLSKSNQLPPDVTAVPTTNDTPPSTTTTNGWLIPSLVKPSNLTPTSLDTNPLRKPTTHDNNDPLTLFSLTPQPTLGINAGMFTQRQSLPTRDNLFSLTHVKQLVNTHDAQPPGHWDGDGVGVLLMLLDTDVELLNDRE
jgi:hypothetical protein